MARVRVEWAAAAVHDLERIDELLTARNERAAIDLIDAVAAAATVPSHVHTLHLARGR